MEALNKYVATLNWKNQLFKSPTISLDDAAGRLAVRESLECDLSPENLHGDGEFSATKVRANAKLFNTALAQLNKLEA